MKKMWWMGALVSLAVLSTPILATAADGGEKPKKARKAKANKGRQPKAKGPRGEYGIMASVLKMDEAQTAELTEAVQKFQEAVKAWESGPSGQKYKELSAAAKKAREDKDKEKMKSIMEEMKGIRKERGDLMTAQKAQIMAVLTDEQKAQWAGFTLYRSNIGRYKKLNLTEEQDKSIRDICAAAAKDMPDTSDRKAYGAARKKLAGEIENVLSDAQKAELSKKPDKKPREPKAGGKGKGKKGARAKGDQPVIVE